MKTHEFTILLFDPTSERTCLFRRCKDFQELKALAKPPDGVDLVCEAAMHLQARCRGWKGDLGDFDMVNCDEKPWTIIYIMILNG